MVESDSVLWYDSDRSKYGSSASKEWTSLAAALDFDLTYALGKWITEQACCSPLCGHRRAAAKNAKRCSRCGDVYYCSRGCQKTLVACYYIVVLSLYPMLTIGFYDRDWPKHKPGCRSPGS